MKMKTLKRNLPGVLTLVWACCISFSTWAQPDAEGVFWKISGGNLQKPSYLFGTYHVLRRSYLEEVPKVQAAYTHADGVVLETVLDTLTMMQFLPKMRMKRTLSEFLNEADYALVKEEVDATLNMTFEMLESFKPAFIMVALTVAHTQEDAVFKKYTGREIDSYFAWDARKRGIPVATFETPAEQIDLLFSHDPIAEQARQLVKMVREKEAMAATQQALTKAYLKDDLAALYAIYEKEEEVLSMAYLLDARNTRWMEKLPLLLKDGNQFVAVGALHLCGDQGLVSLLRGAGYTVEALPVR